MFTLVARMPTYISTASSYCASVITVFTFVNTLAYPTKISFSRLQNVELSAVITLDRASLPMAALEDVTAEELAAPQKPVLENIKDEPLMAGKRGYYQGYTVTRVLTSEPLHISRNNPEILAIAKADTPKSNVVAPIKLNSPASTMSVAPVAVTIPTPAATVAPPPAAERKTVEVKENKPAVPAGLMVSGEIELREGMAFVGGGQSITLKRYVNGNPVEEGTVYLQRGTFEIRVAEKAGRLVAQMQNEKKEVLGEGAFSFENAPPNIEDHIKISIYAKSAGIAGKVISAYSFSDRKIVVSGAKLKLDDLDAIMKSDEDGQFVFNGVSEKSVGILRSNAEGFLPSIQFVSGGLENEVTLYPKKMVDSMLGLTEESVGHLEGIVWGKVTSGGKPLAGATVELAGVSNEPIYFNSLYLPDKRLKQTSSNGIFAYLKIAPGLHQIRANHVGKVIDGTIVPVASGHISPLNLNIPETLTQVRVGLSDFSATAHRWLRGVLRVFGTEDEHDLDKDKAIALSPTRLLSFFDGVAANFYPGRILTAGKRDHIELPLLQPSWLKAKVDEGGFKVDPNRGAVVIQTDTPIESLSLNGREISVTDKDVIKIENKGLLLVNLTSGVNTLISKSAGRADIDLNVIVADPGTVSVVDLRVVSEY